MNLLKHFKIRHDVNIDKKLFQFATIEEFESWKRQEEKQTNELFVIAHGTYKSKTSFKTNYVCHRSGFFKSKGHNIRHLKTQGSKKINGYCPASISLNYSVNGTYEVQYISTHVGHNNELGHLVLSEAERQSLGIKIATKIPFENILDEVRDTISGTLERHHLLTKKDLYNIEKSLNLNNEAHRHRNDGISVDAWVKEVDSTGCVLFYKPQGECCDKYKFLKNDDFALIIMNQGQKEMLQKYGNDCICVDETHGLNMYDFNLNTILILDDMREGFPCSFMVSNRSDEDMMYIFFTSVQNTLGSTLKPKVFMTDMAPVFYNAWVRVMGLPQHRLYCTWHIDRAWRNNLNKVNSREKQVFQYIL